MVLLGVYGTLKQGHYNHNELLSRTPVYSGYVSLKAEMYSNGRYPMLVKSDTENQIYLEVYEIDSQKLQDVDELEEPYGYHRERHDIRQGETVFVKVWIYYYSKGTPPDGFERVENGNFVKQREW